MPLLDCTNAGARRDPGASVWLRREISECGRETASKGKCLIDDKQDHKYSDTLPTERVGIIVYTLMQGRGKRYTTAYLARLVGLQHGSMWAMLAKLSRTIPLRQEIDGWFIEDENS